MIEQVESSSGILFEAHTIKPVKGVKIRCMTRGCEQEFHYWLSDNRIDALKAAKDFGWGRRKLPTKSKYVGMGDYCFECAEKIDSARKSVKNMSRRKVNTRVNSRTSVSSNARPSAKHYCPHYELVAAKERYDYEDGYNNFYYYCKPCYLKELFK